MPRKQRDSLPIEPYFRALPGCEGILRAIAAEPDDDTHRLVLADWLEEHGEAERAEFIRLQCRLAGIPDWVAWILPDEPVRRERQLESANRKHWARRLRWAGFTRGVLEGVWLHSFPDQDWLPLLSRTQQKINIRRVIADLRADDWNKFTSEVLVRVPLRELELRMHAPLGAAEMTALVNAPCFPSLRVLKVWAHPLGADGARVLAEATAPHLTRLVVEAGLEDRGVALLAQARGFPRLQQLGLSYNFIGREGALALAAHPLCDNIAHLDLAHNLLGDAGVAALASSPGLGQLRSLNLRQNEIGPAGAASLARSPLLARLRNLCLYDNRIGEGVAELSRSPNVADLATLELTRNGINSEHVHHLTGSPAWSGLRALHLDYNYLNDAALAVLGGGLTRIEWLSLSGNWIGPAGLSALMESAHLGDLKRLDLSDNPLGNDGAKLIAGCAALGKLRQLSTHTCDIGAPGIMALAESPHLNLLASLDVRHNRGTKAARAALRARYPGSGA